MESSPYKVPSKVYTWTVAPLLRRVKSTQTALKVVSGCLVRPSDNEPLLVQLEQLDGVRAVVPGESEL